MPLFQFSIVSIFSFIDGAMKTGFENLNVANSRTRSPFEKGQKSGFHQTSAGFRPRQKTMTKSNSEKRFGKLF